MCYFGTLIVMQYDLMQTAKFGQSSNVAQEIVSEEKAKQYNNFSQKLLLLDGRRLY